MTGHGTPKGAVLADRPWMVKYGQWLDLSATLARDILRSRAYEGLSAPGIEDKIGFASDIQIISDHFGHRFLQVLV